MRDVDDGLLERMSSRELLELQARVHDAIRAHIRLKNAQMAAAAGPRSAGTANLPRVEQSRQRSLAVRAKAHHAAEAPAALNAASRTGEQSLAGGGAFALERERDAWLARKRKTAG